MTRTFFISSVGSTALLAFALLGQDNPPPAQPGNIDITGIPGPRGIYYHAADGWTALSPRILTPLSDGRAAGLEILNVGSDHTVTQLPGRHASVQIMSDARPTFYLHGISPASLYLVRAVIKNDYRELRMPISRHFWEWTHFSPKDVMDFGIQGVNGDIVAIKPSADLKPGEYTLTSAAGTDYQWLRLWFDFGILGAAGQ